MRRSISIVVACAVVLAITATSCNRKSSSTASGLPTNKQLTIGITQEFDILNPLISQMVATRYIGYMANRVLTAIDTDWKWRCYLCTEVPSLENGMARIIQEGNAKKLLVDWEIKPGSRWGDGTPVTGEDVKLGWEIGKSPNVSVGEKETYTHVESITVDPKEPRKFQMKFKKPQYDFYQLGTFEILPKHIEGPIWEKTKDSSGSYEKQTAYSTDPLNPGLYCGPYLVKELKLGSHVILEPNPFWNGNKPSIEMIVVKLIPDTATLEANLLSGTIDMVGELGMAFDQARAFEQRIARDPALAAKFNVQFRDGMSYEHIDVNLRGPILSDINVRKALVYALDRAKLSQALFEGKQKPAIHNIHPLDIYYTDDVVKYDYDPKKASDLLEVAGWKLGADGIREKAGKKLSLTLMTTAQNKTRELVEVFLQSEWKKVGIDLKLKNEPARVFFGETVRKAQYPDLAMYAWSSSPDNPPHSTLAGSQIPTQVNGYSGQNSCGWSNKVANDILEEKILLEFDPAKRKEMMKKVLYEYTNEVPVIPLYYRAEIATTPRNLKNFALNGHQFYSTLNVENWALETK